MKKGILTVISGPSGVGKDTVFKELLKKDKSLKLSISCTTRKPREYEVDGIDYYFLEKEEFLKHANAGEFLEFAEYCGNFYGTPIKELEKNLEIGYNVVLVIEILGAEQILKKRPKTIGIFILPPSLKELEKRLKLRGTNNEEDIKKRILQAKKEIDFSKNYKYTVVNDDLKTCVDKILKIIQKEVNL